MNTSARALGNPPNVRGLVVGLGILALTWELCAWISAGDNSMLVRVGLACAVLGITVYTLNGWRAGFYLLVVAGGLAAQVPRIICLGRDVTTFSDC
jgi:hypothetical protein